MSFHLGRRLALAIKWDKHNELHVAQDPHALHDLIKVQSSQVWQRWLDPGGRGMLISVKIRLIYIARHPKPPDKQTNHSAAVCVLQDR